MPKTLQEVMAQLPPEQQAAIHEQAAELIKEERDLRAIRVAARKTQAEIARKLRTNQGAVSRLEKQTDWYLSTLRDFVQAVGGELEVIVTFPDRPPVKIARFRPLRRKRSGAKGKPTGKPGKVAS